MNNYIETNRKLWNDRTSVHLSSAFYDTAGFVKGRNTLNEIELNLLGDIKGKSVLHLQCHFGQDSISLSRLGAYVTAVDFSDTAIDEAIQLAFTTNQNIHFICSDIYELPELLSRKFDIVFTSYGTIGWLPDLDKWAKVISNALTPGGRFVFAEFHPFIWMFDNDFKELIYPYFNCNPIVENETGTYADMKADLQHQSITWNHNIAEVLTCLIASGLELQEFQEFDYSPYKCFNNAIETTPGKYILEPFGNKVPMVYALSAIKK